MKRDFWYVEKTECYPNSFKVTNDFYAPDNSWLNFFLTKEIAQAVADERNKLKYTPREVHYESIIKKGKE